MISVFMRPMPSDFKGHESGIRRVVESYVKYLPKYGVEVVGPYDSYDLIAVHAGTARGAQVSHNHGLYFTADYNADAWEWRANSHVIDGVRSAKQVTVPSTWVQEIFQRDMRFSPTVVGHGIEWEKWRHSEQTRGFVLWNKNRGADVCDPYPVTDLARRFPKVPFASTFSRPTPPENVSVIGVVDHDTMRLLVQQCAVYLATTKETFGIGILEAMAAGRPVLGFRHGGITDLITHGVNGYLAEPDNYDDLGEGLAYCLEHASTLGKNGAELVKAHSWDNACEKVAGVYRLALEREPAEVDIVIPVYNKPTSELVRAVSSAVQQTMHLKSVTVVDDGSEPSMSDDYKKAVEGLGVNYIRKENGGVATARNFGISEGSAQYILCLDADDALDPRYLEATVPALEEDESLGIAYTGLQWVKQDGSTGLSDWPGDWDFDAQLRKRNQVPTACVFRREMWRRLGGYKQRYAPQGAGAEDAEFWLRAGAYGWGAKKTTTAGLFIYAWMSGQASGNPDYREPDWLAWHPWVKDGNHPFASYAKPKKWSHAVRQYDQPVISVVIPVGPGHGTEVENAFDSIEAQDFRVWELIAVNDSGEPIPQRILEAYPYVKWVETAGELGAGHARNVGADEAKGSFLLFLDADDWLYPNALSAMIGAWEKEEAAIYTDYIGHAHVDNLDALDPKLKKRVIEYDGTHAVIRHNAFDFDCHKAGRQPENPPYIWNNITTLVPRAWHIEIGGFDTKMPSWEDVDYWWRLAWSGKCFYRIPEPLMVYRYYSGGRRQEGIKEWSALLDYMAKKKEGVEMGCGCNKGKEEAAPPSPPAMKQKETVKMRDGDFIMSRYLHPNKGQHAVIGQATRTKYGYRAGGDVFLVHREDIALQPHLYQEVSAGVSAPPVDSAQTPAPPEPVFDAEEYASKLRTKWDEELDLQTLPGITPTIAKRMENSRLVTREQILRLGTEGLSGAVKGIGAAKAESIIEYLENAAS